MGISFWVFQLLKFIVLALVAYVSGLLAQKMILRVNYTRKINHFAISFLPELLMVAFAISNSTTNILVSTFISILYFVFFTKPIRSSVPLFATMFASIDRPEDRPYTLRWFMIQYFAAILVMIPVYFYFSSIGKISMVYIALFINNIGDGLAEPVGVKFGKHKYTVKAILTNKKYTHSIEGSLCIFVSAIVLLFVCRNDFTMPQLILAFAIVPLIATIAEAKSPHTMDAPFIIGTSALMLAIILKYF